MENNSGKTVLISGAANGIGLAFAKDLGKTGANLVLVDIAADALLEAEASLTRLGGRVIARAMDISDTAAIAALRDDVERVFGGVDVLVNNAAIGPEKNSPRYLIDPPKFWETPDALWMAMLRVNIFGAQAMSKAFSQHMIKRKWGRIVNVTTSLDTMYRQGIGAYGPCKAALEALSRIMAQDLEDTGVTVNVLVPGGPVNTGMVPADCGISAEALIQPEQMCAPLRWLCTNEADGVSGLRIVAQKWREDTSVQERLAVASAPVAWPQLGAQSHFPT